MRNEDFESRRKSPVTYIPNCPLLKTAAESYTGRMYKEFEEEFKEQFLFSCKLLDTNGSILTYTVTHTHTLIMEQRSYSIKKILPLNVHAESTNL